MATATAEVPREGEGARMLAVVDAVPHTVAAALEDAFAGGPAVLPVDPNLPARARGAVVAALRPGAARRDDGLVLLPGGTGVHDDTVLVVPTSGSMGAPRAVELSAAALEASVEAGLARTGADPAVPWLACLPVTHVAGVLVLLRARAASTPAVLHDAFDAGRVAAEPGPVHLALVPTMLRRVLAAGGRPERWATLLVGGAAAPGELPDGAVRTYGMTETAGGCVYDGVPLEGVEVAVVDGVIRVRGSVLLTRYRLGEDPRDADGWFVTADLGRFTRDGRLEVIGRVDDVINTGGVKVVATAVAARIAEHPAVAEAAVVGVDDPEWGQRVVAFVVPARVGAAISLAALRDFVGDQLGRQAAPQDLVVTNALPRLDNGKLDRMALRAALR